jgi:hypothetical protein
MPSVFTANSSGILVNNENVEGVRGIQYQLEREQGEVHALGSPERIAVYYGASRVQGTIRVASVSNTLDGLATSGEAFQVVANLTHGQAARSVSFDECHIAGKEFAMTAGGHAEAVYSFTATRVREEDQSQPATA